MLCFLALSQPSCIPFSTLHHQNASIYEKYAADENYLVSIVQLLRSIRGAISRKIGRRNWWPID
jgi:hypothetical protein